MKKALILLTAVTAMLATGCGKAEEEDSPAVSSSSKAEVTASSAAEKEDSSSEAEEEESSVAESPEESESKSAETEASVPEEPEAKKPELVHVQGTGYSFEVDLNCWKDAMGQVAVTEIGDGNEGVVSAVEHIYGWKNDGRSSCMFAHYIADTDYTGRDIYELGEIVANNADSIEGESLISWDIQNFSGIDWIRSELALDPNVFGTNGRALQYDCVRGKELISITFTIAEESVSDIDGDLRALLESVVLE